MTRSEFDALVERLQRDYAGRPEALARRTLLAAALGYCGFLAWVAVFGMVAGAFFVGAAFVEGFPGALLAAAGGAFLAVGLWQAAALLWLPPGEDAGVALNQNLAPQLFELIVRLRHELRAPRIHRVIMNADLNASLRRENRLGLLGWRRNVMTLGLPLLDALDAGEFESVVAHECAHMSAYHGRLGAWSYRVRETWLQLAGRMQQPAQSAAGRILRRGLSRFFDWYWRRFHAYFFVASRTHEYQADRCAAERAGADAAARALWKIDVVTRRVDQRFWPELSRLARDQPEPPDDVTFQLAQFLAKPPAPADADRWRRQASMQLPGSADTHPSLRERIEALGRSIAQYSELEIQAPRSSAAARFLGEGLDGLRRSVDEAWRDAVAPAWRTRGTRLTALQRRCDQLRQSARPTLEKNWELAAATLELDGDDAAEPFLRNVLAEQPNHAAANAALAQILLNRGDAAGETHAWLAIEGSNLQLARESCEMLALHYRREGNQAELLAVQDEWDALENPENSGIPSPSSAFEAVELAPDDEAQLRSALDDPRLEAAYLVRQRPRRGSRQQVFVLCVCARRRFGRRTSREERLVAHLIPRVRLPGKVLVISPTGPMRLLAKKVVAVPDARL